MRGPWVGASTREMYLEWMLSELDKEQSRGDKVPGDCRATCENVTVGMMVRISPCSPGKNMHLLSAHKITHSDPSCSEAPGMGSRMEEVELVSQSSLHFLYQGP